MKSEMKAELVVPEDQVTPVGMDLVQQVIDPKIAEFEEWFKTKSSGSRLAPYEREIIRSFSWFLLIEDKS